MTGPETLSAAADALRVDGGPLHDALADWIGDTIRHLQVHTGVWTRTYDPERPAGLVEINAGALYAFALALARTVLEEVPCESS